MGTLHDELQALGNVATADRMATARAAKAARKAAKPAEPTTATVDRMPGDRDELIVYSLIYALSLAQKDRGTYVDKNGVEKPTSYFVPWFMLMDELKGTGYMSQLESRVTEIIDRLVVGGFVKRAGSKGFIPTVFDEPFVKGARSVRGGRSSALRHNIDAMLERRHAKIDAA